MARASTIKPRHLAKALKSLHIKNVGKKTSPQKGANQGKGDRAKFWSYCQAAAGAARHRSRRRAFPCNIDAYAIDELLVTQGWRCAVSGVELSAPSIASKSGRDPFGPSLDRIVPSL